MDSLRSQQDEEDDAYFDRLNTRLEILSRITEPTEGYAETFGGRVGSLLEVGTGSRSDPELPAAFRLTGRENITLNGAILGMKRAEIDAKFDEIVAFAEVEKFIDTPVKHYSSGMYVRLAFAVAAHRSTWLTATPGAGDPAGGRGVEENTAVQEGGGSIMEKHVQKGTAGVDVLSEVIRRIVEVAQPEKIILFGSAARAELGPHSDLDLLVIKASPIHRGHLTEKIYMNLLGVGQAVDVVVVTPEDIERYGNVHCLIIAPALREGRAVYERTTTLTG